VEGYYSLVRLNLSDRDLHRVVFVFGRPVLRKATKTGAKIALSDIMDFYDFASS